MRLQRHQLGEIIVGVMLLIAVIVALTVSSYSKLNYHREPSNAQILQAVKQLQRAWCSLLHPSAQPEDMKAMEGLMEQCKRRGK